MKMHATLTGCGKDPEKGKRWGGTDLPTRWQLTLTNERGTLTLNYWTGSLVPAADTTPARVLAAWLRDIADAVGQTVEDYISDYYALDDAAPVRDILAMIAGHEDARRAAATLAELIGYPDADTIAEVIRDYCADADPDEDRDDLLDGLAASWID